MSHHGYHSLADLPKPGHFHLPKTAKHIFIACVAIGVVSFAGALFQDATRAWYNYLIGYFYWMSIALFGAFITAIHHATGSQWSTPVRRLAEGMSSFLPVAAVLLLGLFLGLHHLYEWTHVEEVAKDVLLSGKSAYLNTPFFIIRSLVGMAIWAGFAHYFTTKSLEQDQSGAISITKGLIKASVIFLPLFALSFTMASFDDIMSVEPHFFSTIFGVYQFSSLFYSGVTTLTIIVILMQKQGLLKGLVTEHHMHDLGKWMFAFTVFWAYIAFSQYMLIWYANLPEETFYFIKRQENGWQYWALSLAILKFIVPFFLLIGKWAKVIPNYLLSVGVLMLVANWIDLYWQVAPAYSEFARLGWQELGIFVGFLGLFGLTVSRFYSRHPLVPMKDPYLLDGVNHNQF
ncbi:MAG: molybdopterin oxidoreductase [Deltaproteobacteria bacterium CG11_big_fil_rev_8_21_14_0_20_47_16]|nr:MAG: molybdopterin oxidoreductase [Deltaproteobacteria bacterium CG11_big_fil_rev_8_21_14_0_20_47_16]